MTTSATFRAAAIPFRTVASSRYATPGVEAPAFAEPGISLKPTKAKRTPRTSRTAGFSASARFMPAPKRAMPLASKRSSVSRRAPMPWSVMWFDASVTTSTPAPARSGATFGSIEKTVPLSCWRNEAVMGHSKSLSVISASEIRARTAPSLPVRFASTTGQPLPSGPSKRRSIRVPVYAAVPPPRTQSQPFPRVFDWWLTPRSGQVSPVEMRVRTSAGSNAVHDTGAVVAVPTTGYSRARTEGGPKRSAPATRRTFTRGVTRAGGRSPSRGVRVRTAVTTWAGVRQAAASKATSLPARVICSTRQGIATRPAAISLASVAVETPSRGSRTSATSANGSSTDPAADGSGVAVAPGAAVAPPAASDGAGDPPGDAAAPVAAGVATGPGDAPGAPPAKMAAPTSSPTPASAKRPTRIVVPLTGPAPPPEDAGGCRGGVAPPRAPPPRAPRGWGDPDRGRAMGGRRGGSRDGIAGIVPQEPRRRGRPAALGQSPGSVSRRPCRGRSPSRGRARHRSPGAGRLASGRACSG